MVNPTADRSPNLDQAILIWNRLQVPKDLELDTEWAGLVQPLIRAPGHEGSGWARLQRPDMILLVTGWKRTLDQREFTASPSAQLYRENLQSRGIIHVSSHETFSRRIFHIDALLKSYVQLFWIYFPAPVTEAHKAQISKLKGSREPVRGINELVHGQEAQLMLWPHFWRNAEAAEYRHWGKYSMTGNPIVGGRTLLERFGELLEEVGPMEWREEFVDFKPITYV